MFYEHFGLCEFYLNSSRTLMESMQETFGRRNMMTWAQPPRLAHAISFSSRWPLPSFLPSSTYPPGPCHQPPLRPTQLELITSCSNYGHTSHRMMQPPEAWWAKKALSHWSLRRGAQPAHALILDSWPPELKENKFLLFQVTKSLVICYGSHRKPTLFTSMIFSFLIPKIWKIMVHTLLGCLSEIMYRKHLAQELAGGKCSIRVN